MKSRDFSLRIPINGIFGIILAGNDIPSICLFYSKYSLHIWYVYENYHMEHPHGVNRQNL